MYFSLIINSSFYASSDLFFDWFSVAPAAIKRRFRLPANHFFLRSPRKSNQKESDPRRELPITAGRQLTSWRLLEVFESSTFENSTAALGAF
jgi:hypothetical protein